MKNKNELSYKQLKMTCDPKVFKFETTENLETITTGIGQDRGIKALEFGVNVNIKGYNIYIDGPSGVGKTMYTKNYLRKIAKKKKVPVVLHESNAFPGVAVKMLSNKASKILVGFEDAKARLPKAKKVVVTGTPTKVKKVEISALRKQELLKENKLESNKPIVLFFGGSQGAKSINNSLLEIISKKQNQDYQILWAAGPKQYDQIKNELKEKYSIEIDNIPNVSIVPYIYNMEEIMNIVDLVVSRSGAMTITEIANVGVPAIFIPFPFATENHQEYNAKVLKNVGAAKIILDKNLTAKELNSTISNLVKDKKVLKEMGEKAHTVAIQDVEEKIYKEIKEVV